MRWVLVEGHKGVGGRREGRVNWGGRVARIMFCRRGISSRGGVQCERGEDTEQGQRHVSGVTGAASGRVA